MVDMIYSPIFYTGNKTKLIKRGLIDLFPEQINSFIDVFFGSGVVSFNTNAKSYIINDNNKHTVDLIRYFLDNSSKDIILNIDNLIRGFELEYTNNNNEVSFDNRSKKYNRELSDIHKERYISFRNVYNKDKTVDKLYVLLIYSFSHQMRFNDDGNFNMPCGNGVFTNENRCWIEDFPQDFRHKVHTHNLDFREFMNQININKNDFVYFDPPYYNSTATYNENGGWTMQDDSDLFSICERLNANGIKFGMSNVFKIRGKENSHLIEWCKKNNWKVCYFDKVAYSANGKGNADAQEVFICNY